MSNKQEQQTVDLNTLTTEQLVMAAGNISLHIASNERVLNQILDIISFRATQPDPAKQVKLPPLKRVSPLTGSKEVTGSFTNT